MIFCYILLHLALKPAPVDGVVLPVNEIKEARRLDNGHSLIITTEGAEFEVKESLDVIARELGGDE